MGLHRRVIELGDIKSEDTNWIGIDSKKQVV